MNETADFLKCYRHKNIILAEIRDASEQVTLSDLLELIQQIEVYSFHDWFSRKLEYDTFIKRFKIFINSLLSCFIGILKIIQNWEKQRSQKFSSLK